MQCFRVGYRGICHASLVFSVYKRAFINLREIYRNFRKLRKCFKPVIEELYTKKIYENFAKSLPIFGNVWKTSGTVQKCFTIFLWFLKFSGNLRKSSEVFGNLRKFSGNVGNGSKVIFRCFYDFLKFSENLRKSSEAFGNLRKISGRDRKCS